MDAFSLFPYGEVRPEQRLLISDVYDALQARKCMIAHAPTGLGKTAASLAPALSYALQNNLTVFFLTSRNTQHLIAIDTLKEIWKRHPRFSVTDVIGKNHMCGQDVDAFFSRQFHDYCSSLREAGTCFFYSNFRKDGSVSAEGMLVADSLRREPVHSGKTVELGKKYSICPYEAAVLASKDASVIVADYSHIFSPNVRDSFLKRAGKSLQDSIIIIDEAHNLPSRLRDILSETITTPSVERAVREAEKFGGPAKKFLADFRNALLKLGEGHVQRLVGRDELLGLLKGYDIEDLLGLLDRIADSVMEVQKQSFIGVVSGFLKAWLGNGRGYARILTRKAGPIEAVSLSYRCLDPGAEAGMLIGQARSVILMSGTLTPTSMYRDILGFPNDTVEKQYQNPFPPENRLSLIIPSATTRFSRRGFDEFLRIGKICSDAINEIPGNVAVFFSSYEMMDHVYRYIYGKSPKKVFRESPHISKAEKHQLLEGFRNSGGGLLLAVIGGSFSEGIDLPGDLLNGVLIVGLPLQRPDLETTELIKYYDGKYRRGWDYGYVFPAFTKALQSAGRCIRSESDRGVILYIDERYAWPRYFACFPKDSAVLQAASFQQHIRKFWQQSLNNG